VKDKRFSVPDAPLTLRLVIAKVIDPKTRKELARWYLLSNVDQDVDASTIALWYYYRWQIESYFKLLKSGGQKNEHWQQESGLAILKRLLVVSMACSVVWSLQRNESEEATELKQVWVRLSGKLPTAGTLLSGLFVLMRILDFLDSINHDLTQIDNSRIRLANFAEYFCRYYWFARWERLHHLSMT
jgi:hypothetical protein